MSVVGEKILLFREAFAFFCIQVKVNIRSAFAVNASYLLMVLVRADRKLALAEVDRDPVSFRVDFCVNVIAKLPFSYGRMPGVDIISVCFP
ncbi:hypothetical protein WOC76_22225 [Methylocystis sp. IM3]|uniref:hypothetical protein n=1 Tax=unclassified Methylocystis TaxID=2625913 RepID=UPI0030F8A421